MLQQHLKVVTKCNNQLLESEKHLNGILDYVASVVKVIPFHFSEFDGIFFKLFLFLGVKNGFITLNQMRNLSAAEDNNKTRLPGKMLRGK